MLFLSNADVRAVIDLPDVGPVLDTAYRGLATGETLCRPRIDLRLPTGRPGEFYQWGSMEGGSTASGYFAVRIKSDVVAERAVGSSVRQDKFCSRPGRYCGLIGLFSVRDGAPLALLQDGYLQHLRVAADSCLGARLVARPESAVLGLLGSGAMAWDHVRAFAQAFPLRRVQVFSPTAAHRDAFAARVRAELHLAAVAVAEPATACAGADLVCGCTSATGVVVQGAWLEPGVHLTCIGGHLDEEARAGIDVWLRLGDAPAPVNAPGWDFEGEYLTFAAVADRAATTAHPRQPPADRCSYADLLAGRHAGRQLASQVTFSERGNVQGAQFFGLAGLVYERALSAGLGLPLPLEQVLQDIRD